MKSIASFLRFIGIGLLLIFTASCKKEEVGLTNTVKDIEGNIYNTVTIGTQTWMKENLKTTRYRDSSLITKVTNDKEWMGRTSGAYCWYDNYISNKDTYGALYNYYAVVDSRSLCPYGWYVPTDNDWKILIDYIGGYNYSAIDLEAPKIWDNINTREPNKSGFTAIPSGYRIDQFSWTFNGCGYRTYWWSTSEVNPSYAWTHGLDYMDDNLVQRDSLRKNWGVSVRCIQDQIFRKK